MVIIGNVGSKNQFDYRALGDAVNTAARIESVNKYLGSRVCISASTVSKNPNFIGRPIGSLLLQRKSKFVKTFEPLSKVDYKSSRCSNYFQAFELLDKNADKAKSIFNTLLVKYPEVRLIAFLAKRLNDGISGKKITLNSK